MRPSCATTTSPVWGSSLIQAGWFMVQCILPLFFIPNVYFELVYCSTMWHTCIHMFSSQNVKTGDGDSMIFYMRLFFCVEYSWLVILLCLCWAGIVTDGGARPNIIPRRASLEYYIRTPKNRDLKKLERKLRNCIQGAALATNCEVCNIWTCK